MAHLDNILITHSDLARHHKIVQEVFWRLREHCLFLCPEKCKFEKSTIEYLGVIILHNHVEMDPIKVASVAAWPAPENKKDMQQFLSFTNFYQRLIQAFSDVAWPLFDLTKKGVDWTWTAASTTVFQALKDTVTTELILVLPDESQPYWLEADSFDPTTRAILLQQGTESGALLPSTPRA
jgi:hypothetical protein